MVNILKKSTGFIWVKWSALLVVISMMVPNDSVAKVVPSNVSFQVFYDELTPYGDWLMDPNYGYVWVPYAERGFQPYATNGYWVMTNYGNTWVSNYDWGWAPFHYGRWYFDDYLGWAWVPGYEWGPAWVNWRTGGDYYGWAPLMPGLTIHVAVNIPTNYWVFVPKRRLVSRNIYNYYVPRRNVYNIYNQTTVINNTYVYNNYTYVSGPARRDVEKVTRRSVPVYEVNRRENPGRTAVGRNSLEVYQPAVRRNSGNGEAQARPARVYTANEHKANIVSRSSAANSSRTAPANSRINNTRASEAASRQESRTRQEATQTQNPVRSMESRTQVQHPVRSQGSESQGSVSRENQRATQRQPAVNRQPSERQSPSTVSPRVQPPQQKSREQVTPANRNVQTPRQNESRTQEVGRGNNSTRVSPATTNDRSRSTGTTSRTSTQSRGASRGNN